MLVGVCSGLAAAISPSALPGRRTPRAAWRGEESVVRLLLEEGADPAAVDNTGKTALDYAASPSLRALLTAAAQA